MTRELYKTNLSAEAIFPNEMSEKLEAEITNDNIYLKTSFTNGSITFTHEEFKELIFWVEQYEKARTTFY